MHNYIKRQTLQLIHLVHLGIDHFWIHPLESKLIPRLEMGNQTRFRSAFLKWASWWANVGRISVLDLRVNVKRLAGLEWSVIYIGNGTMLEALSTMLFPKQPNVDELSRVYLWQVPALVQRFTDEGNLVVCELNEILRWSFTGLKTSFIVPIWIKQVLEEIDRPMEDILGFMHKDMRRNIRKVEKQGFSYRLTQEKEDFDFFYYKMYLPYIKLRHDGQGMSLDNYESAYDFIKKGKLILIMDSQDPVCGGIFRLDGDMCVGQIMGVLDADYDLVKRGVNVALYWSMLNWARAHGAKRINFGSSRAFTSDGVFNFKRQWGTRVYFHKDKHTQWSFYAQKLPENFQGYLNKLGFITRCDGKGYRVIINGLEESSSTADFTRELKQAAACGLSGLVVISENNKLQLISQASD